MKTTNKHLFYFLAIGFIITILLAETQAVKAQGDPAVIQLSGLIVDGDSAYGVPGVHVYIPKAGRGTVTNGVGFFSMPTMQGDTVVISAVGYKKQRLIVPRRTDDGFTVLIDLQLDTTYLPIVEVFPYPTEELFKEAFLALNLPQDREEQIAKNLNPESLALAAASMGMDAGANHRFYMNQQSNQISNQFFAPSFSILNPFAWAEFIKSVKRGDLKNKRKKRK